MRDPMTLGRSLLLGFLATVAATIPVGATVTRHRVGNPRDVTAVLHGPAYNLGGGSRDVFEALQWMIDQVRGGDPAATVDVVVLRATGTDAYNQRILSLKGVNSVETLVISSREEAEDPEVEATVRRAEVVFFAGGNQSHYVKHFKGTRLDAAVKSVVARGGAVGGTSAGCAILGQAVFDACRLGAKSELTSAKAQADPYHPEISFTTDWFRWPHLEGVLTDTHFVPRDRMGRTMAFLARLVQDRFTPQALGVAVNERSSLVIDRNGMARVLGEGPVYMVLADHRPEVCQPGRPLSYLGFKLWRLGPGQTFDLARRPTSGFVLRSVVEGRISEDPYLDAPGSSPQP